MASEYSVDEVLIIAQKIERNGRRFYEAAAEMFPKQKDWFLELAAQEEGHEGYYARLHEKLVGSEFSVDGDPRDYDQLAVKYIHMIADEIVFKTTLNPNVEFTGRESLEQVLSDAIKREQESILFYSGIRTALDDAEMSEGITSIINEEMRHLKALKEKRSTARSEIVEKSAEKTYELVIIGAGPGGIAAAAEAIAQGVDAADLLVLEQAARDSWIVRTLYPEQKLVTVNYKGVRGEASGVMRMRNMAKTGIIAMLSETIEDFGITVLYETAADRIARHDGVFEVSAGKKKFRGKTCIIAIGVFGEPNQPDYQIPRSIRHKTQFDITSSRVSDQSVLVVGGGDSAAEYVQHLLKEGNRLAISSREADFSFMNEENRKTILQLGQAGRIKVHAGTDIEKVEPDQDRIKVSFKSGSQDPVLCDRIVYALGGTTPMNFLKVAGIEIDSDATHPRVGANGETNIEGLFLVGDLAAPEAHGAIATAFTSAHLSVVEMVEKGMLKRRT